MSNISQPESYSQRLTASIIIPLLTAVIRVRKAGLIFLLAFFLINCYFMLFDQAAYITFLDQNISPDGNITDINSAFFKLQTSIILLSIFWYLIDQASIDLMAERSLHPQTNSNWLQRPFLYIAACIIWLLISYLPYLFLDSQTIISLIEEDGFFQNCGAIWLFISSMLLFYLYYSEKVDQDQTGYNRRWNIWFLLLGLLFFFGAGEEISWGQRIFHFETPAFMASNLQNEFSIHNLPWFDGRSEKPFDNEHDIEVAKIKTGFIETHLTASSLFYDFCFLSLILLPLSHLINHKIRAITRTLRLPIAPIYSGVFFIIGYNISKIVGDHYAEIATQARLDMAWVSVKADHGLVWGASELYETFMSFLFMTVAIWLICHNHSLTTKNPKSMEQHQ